MEMDKKVIKALASDTRVDILKNLIERGKMPTELSKQMSLAPSTIVEHLKLLESAGLVDRKHTGHKWIYYELTSKGKNVVAPKFPIDVILILSAGIILSVFSFMNFYSIGAPTFSAQNEIAGVVASAPADLAKQTSTASPDANLIFFILFAIGLAIIGLGLWKFFRTRN